MNRLSIIIFLLLSGVSLVWAQGSSVGTAAAIPLNGSASATMSNTSTDHYWKVTLPANGYLRVEVNSASNIDVDVSLRDTDGSTTIHFDGRSGTYSEVFGFLKTGTYYLYCNRWSGTTGNYTISNSFVAPSRAADTEPNDTYTQAITLNLGSTATGHLGFYGNGTTDTKDYWKVVTAQNGLLTVKMRHDSLDLRADRVLDFDLELLDVNGTTHIISDAGTSTFSEVSWPLRPGTYYVYVNYWSGRGGSYELRADLFPPPRPNDTEGNDSPSTATMLVHGVESSGHIGYYSNGSTDTQDYWRIVAPSNDSLYVHVVSDDVHLELDLDLYGPDGTTHLSSDGRYGISSRVGTRPTTGTTYYVRVWRWSGMAGSYSILATNASSRTIVNVERERSVTMVPTEYVLEQNYPNPFNPATTIRYALPKATRVRVAIYSILGQEVQVLFDSFQSAGYHMLVWDGKNSQGANMPSGAYLVRLSADGRELVRKLLLLR